MRSILRQIVPPIIAGSLAVLMASLVSGWQPASSLNLTRLYTGPDRQTHADNIEVKLTSSSQYSEAESSEPVKVSEAQFFRLQKGRVQDWHNPVRRQYVVALTGQGEVEIAGSQKIPLRPGRVLLLENVSGRGHITRSFGPDDLTFFIVPLANQ